MRHRATLLAVLIGLAAALLPAEAARAAVTDLYGGDPFRLTAAQSALRCHVGFAVSGGFVSSACGRLGDPVYSAGGVLQGTVAKVTDRTHGGLHHVRTNNQWAPRGYVRSGTTLLPVRGRTEAAVGAQVCMHAASFTARCGTVTGRDLTLYFADGSISGITRASICVGTGDPLGPLISGDQAQGVILAANGTCTAGLGVVYYVPLPDLLTAHSLSLITVT